MAVKFTPVSFKVYHYTVGHCIKHAEIRHKLANTKYKYWTKQQKHHKKDPKLEETKSQLQTQLRLVAYVFPVKSEGAKKLPVCIQPQRKWLNLNQSPSFVNERFI